MRRWVGVILLLLLVAPAAWADITTNNVQWLEFNDASGSNANDSTANNNDGTMVNEGLGVDWTSSGNAHTGASAIDFNGGATLGYIDLGLPINSTSSGDKTWACWVYPTNAQTGYILSNRDGAGDVGVSVLYNSDLTVGIGWNTNINTVKTTATIALNTWTHLAATYTTGGTGGVIYINGSSSVSGDLGTESTTTNKLKYGGRWSTADSGNSAPFQGRIDDCRLYSRVLSSSDITELFGGASVPPRRKVLLLY